MNGQDLSVKEFASLAGLSPRTVERYLAANLIPGAWRASPTSHWRIPPNARDGLSDRVQKWLRGKTRSRGGR